MSKRINLDREVTSCDDCEVFQNCKKKSIKSKSCFRKAMRDNFDKIYNDDTEEADDL